MDLFHSPEELIRQLEAAKARVREIEENDDPAILMARLRAAHPQHPTLWARGAFLVTSALAAVSVALLLAMAFLVSPPPSINRLEHAVGLPLPVVGLVVSVCMAIGYYMTTQAALAIGRSCSLLDHEQKEHERHMTDVRQLTGQKSIMERMRSTPKGARSRGATPGGAINRFGDDEGPPTRQRQQGGYTPPLEIPAGRSYETPPPSPEPVGKRERTPVRSEDRDEGPRITRNLPKPALNAEGFLGTPVQDLVRQHTRKNLPENKTTGPVRGRTTPEDPDQLVRVRRDNRVPLPMSDLDDDRDETARRSNTGSNPARRSESGSGPARRSDTGSNAARRRSTGSGSAAWAAPAARAKQTEDDDVIEEDPRAKAGRSGGWNASRPLASVVDADDEPTADMDSYSDHIAPAVQPRGKTAGPRLKKPSNAAADLAAERRPTPRLSRTPTADDPWVAEVLERAQKTSQVLPVQARFLYSVEPALPFTLSLDRMGSAMALRVTEAYLEFLAAIPTPPRGRIVLNDAASVDRAYLRNVETALEPHFDDRAKVSRNGDFVEIKFMDPDPAWRDAPDLSSRRA